MLWGVKELPRPAMRKSFRFTKLIDGRMGYHFEEGPPGFVSLRSTDSRPFNERVIVAPE